MLASRGLDVVGVDPAAASLDVARSKPGADRVQWLLGDATTLPPLQVDLATMTGNVAQVFLTDHEWLATLHGVRDALRPAGRFVFEVRDPSREPWREWTRDGTRERVDVTGAGMIDHWVDVTAVDGQLIRFTGVVIFEGSGDVINSDSTLRFREREEIETSLQSAGFALLGVRDAPDRPGREFVFVAERPA